MSNTLIASDISSKYKLIIPPPGKRCYIIIGDTTRVEMVYDHVKGAAGGIVWFFVCPVTKKRCRKLHFKEGIYVHWSAIKGYYRNNKPAWWSESPLNKILIMKQAAIDAEKAINGKHFKAHYAGKPTKRYIKCLKQLEDGSGISMADLINGNYGN